RHCIRTTHAEQNAIVQAARAGVSINEATLYCKMTPCYTCAKMIINAGIKKVVCAMDYHAGSRSKELFLEAGVEFILLNESMLSYSDMGNNKNIATTNIDSKTISTKIENPVKKFTDRNLQDVFIYDEFNPEDTAMLQALYSRSPESVENHVNKVRETGSGKFMETFYVGYGHSSIADCGSTTIFIENISILADKAIQDWALYSGQETSTRYVDMSKQKIVDPVNTFESKNILNDWMNFYITSQEKVEQYLQSQYPRKENEKESVYNKAIKARAFDILRGFLPAGITTQLSWHTNLRQAWDKLSIMKFHPLNEVREISEKIIKILKGKYPHSFCFEPTNEQDFYKQTCNIKYNYFAPKEFSSEFKFFTDIKISEINEYKSILERPTKTGLPDFLTEMGLNKFEFLLDYGSFRDIQRHRHGVCRMPLLTTRFGFHNWYISQLPVDLQNEANILIEKQKEKIDNLFASAEIKQYYIPLGFLVPCRVSYGLPAAVYVAELRSGKPVHPTLRQIAHKMCFALTENFPNLKLNCDLEKDDWDVRRGLQDIIKK
ncbi:MAG: FAD-dependent thymidylate synthase, partial [Patescibacteria group bacterium]